MPDQDYVKMANSYDFFLERALTRLRKTVAETCVDLGCPKVLEVACGTGSQARYFAERGFDYRGIDISEPMLAVARAKGMNCDRADGTALPFAEGEFDAVTLSLALHETGRAIRESLVAEMLRVAKPGGALIFADYALPPRRTPAAWLNRAVMFAVERFVGGDHYRNYLDFMGLGGLTGFAEAAGLETAEIRYIYAGAMAVLTARKPG